VMPDGANLPTFHGNLNANGRAVVLSRIPPRNSWRRYSHLSLGLESCHGQSISALGQRITPTAGTISSPRAIGRMWILRLGWPSPSMEQLASRLGGGHGRASGHHGSSLSDHRVAGDVNEVANPLTFADREAQIGDSRQDLVRHAALRGRIRHPSSNIDQFR